MKISQLSKSLDKQKKQENTEQEKTDVQNENAKMSKDLLETLKNYQKQLQKALTEVKQSFKSVSRNNQELKS